MNGKKARQLRRQAYKTGKNYSRDQKRKRTYIVERGTRKNIGLRQLYRDLNKVYRSQKVPA